MPKDISELLFTSDAQLHDVVDKINKEASGIALIVDDRQRLQGVITDGDIRRHALKGLDLSATVREALDGKEIKAAPITAHINTSREDVRALLQQAGVRHIPLVDDEQRVVDVALLNDFLAWDSLPIQAMVLAGGIGSRLKPLTDTRPKPMLPLGDRPLLEHIIRQLGDVGIRRVNVATHYLADQIIDYFGDGSDFGVDLNYVSEERPLGTAGALGLIDEVGEPLLVINGDILTKINFHAMLAYHQEHRADLTMAVRKYDFKIPYGVVECEGPSVKGLNEKPEMRFFVNAGVYLLQPIVIRYIDNGESLDMTDLIQRLIGAGREVSSFPVLEYWIDIGQLTDYEQAQADIRDGKL